ncbi:MAG: HsdM family class I SAM-dependent methyltransferase, partial [Bacteroidia bacterium]
SIKIMAKETGVERASRRVASIPKKKLSTPRAPTKATTLTASIVAKGPVLLYSHTILSEELRAIVDEKWDACWPVSSLKPLALLDLLCYLLFIKKLEEKQLITGSLTRIPGDNGSPADELSWSGFKDMNAQNLHKLFTNENGITDLIKNYGLTNLQYSAFLKGPLLLSPTATLLFNMVAIIKIMDVEGSDIEAAIFEYLLNKVEIEAQNGQVYAPDKIVKLITELMQPTEKDLIWDPSTGNGSFLVNSAMYIKIKNAEGRNNINNDFSAHIYKGIECDPIQLRIGAMNMILHGIEDPKLGGVNTFNNANLSSCEQPTLVLSNLFFDGTQYKKPVEGNTLLTEPERPEINFLNLILKTLKKGGRGAVIVKDYILSNHTPEIRTIRQQIIDDHKLEAVISLTTKGGSLFSGAGILIFSEMKTGINDKVWFYKMKPAIKNKEADSTSSADIGRKAHMEEYDEITDIINRWKNVEEENTRLRTDNSFYVSIDEIKNNNYNLSFNEYRKVEKIPQLYTPPTVPIADKGIIRHNSIVEKARLNFASLKKLAVQLRPNIKWSSLKLPGQLDAAIKRFSLKKPKQLNLGIKRFSLKMPKQLNLDIKWFLLKLPGQLDIAIKRVSIKLRQQLRPVIRRFSIKLSQQVPLVIKSFFPGLVSPTLIGVVVLAFYFMFSINKNDKVIVADTKANNVHGKNKPTEAVPKLVTGTQGQAMLSQEQIKAIVYDTTGIIHFDEQSSGNFSNSLEDSVEEALTNDNDDIVISESSNKKYKPETLKNALSAKYTVRDTTFFHNKPDERTRRNTYLDPLNNNILNPIEDKNGFIYIVYTNHLGRTSKGWINKKDLMPLR